MQPYTNDFYISQKTGSRQSAEVIAPLIIQLVKPRSIVDVACGIGTWMSVFKTLGVTDILDIDRSRDPFP